MKEYITHQLLKTEKELALLCNFLRTNQLPADDLKLKDSIYLGYYDSHDNLVGSGGLEFYGGKTLLRSLAVSQLIRSQSLGKQIVGDLIEQVKSNDKKEIYLLTTTAFYFFLKFGFTEVNRNEVPDEIKMSSEFSRVCPDSARVMKLIIN
jgi:amino-acid N-acetyltransferase